MMRRLRGYTLIELVTVLVLIGALAVFASAQFRTQGFERYAFREELISAARYAQKIALASGCEVRLRVNSTGYELHYRGAAPDDQTCGTGGFGDPVSDPASGGPYKGSFDAVTDGLTVIFGTDGVPTDAEDDGGRIELQGQPDIVIESGTGYVHEA